MNIYTYWNNRLKYHGELLDQIQAKSITEADKIFEEKHQIDLIKSPWIGCSCCNQIK